MFSLLIVFRIVAFLEGVSYILLLGIASPLKWFFDEPKYVKLLGIPHGLLFIAYVIMAVIIGSKLKWSNKTLLNVLAASVIPFGTFFMIKKHLKQAS